MTYRESELRGTIKSQTEVTGDEWCELRNAQLRVFIPGDVLAEDVASEDRTQREAAEVAKNGELYDLMDDPEAHVTKVVTSEGEFLLIAQNMDGHGVLTIAEKED
jgi:hypothetical protein